MFSQQQFSQRSTRGARWRAYFTALRGIPHHQIYDRSWRISDYDLSRVRFIFDDEAGDISRKQFGNKVWYIKNWAVNETVIQDRNIFVDAVTILYWMKSLPMPKPLPDQRWLYLMGTIPNRHHRYFLFQMARQKHWPIEWSCISTTPQEMPAIENYYKKFRRNWHPELPAQPFDVFPTSYNNNIKLFRDKTLDSDPAYPMMPKNRSTQELDEAWPSYRLHICAETLVDATKYPNGYCPFITEKTFRAIAHGKPTVWSGSPGTIKYLNDQGYRTWNNYFDESYDNEINVGKRFKMICQTLEDINSWSEQRWQQVWPDMIEIARHNQQNLVKHHRRSWRNMVKVKNFILNQ